MLFVTVVVPVKNEAAAIEPTLRALLTQDYPRDRYEVIVADGGSEDATVPIVRRLQAEFPHLRLVFNPAGYSSAGRNTAIRHMRGDVAVIVDGHCVVPTRRYLHEVVRAFDASQADSLGRPQPLDAPQATPFQRAVSLARASRLGHNPSSDIFSETPKFVNPSSTAVAYRREVFTRIGLFDPRFDACEDVEFNHRVQRAGMTCYFAPTLAVQYHPRQSFGALFRQLGRYGCGRARLAAKFPDSLTVPALIPPLWAAGLAVGGLAAVLSPRAALGYLAVVAVYLVAVVGAGWLVTRGQPLSVVVRAPLVFVGIHFGYAWGFWQEVIRQARVRLQSV
jgi:GT2 family glycosyltransferase